MKQIRVLTLPLALWLFCAVLLGCTSSSESPALPADLDTAEEIVATLCSPEFEGRASGSTGGQKAAAYIAGYLESLGLETLFLDTYYQEYGSTIYQPGSLAAQVTLTTAEGELIPLEAGLDYLCSLPRTAVELALPIFTDPEACRDGAGIYFAPDRLSCIQWQQENPGSAAFFCEPVRNGEQTALLSQREGTLLILDSAFSELCAEGASLSIRLSPALSEGAVWNVAALRRGSEGENALVFCAHFDGSGMLGEQLFPSALDNASGTAAMMRIAALVQQAAPDLKNDLIFAAFNGEEVGMDGSQAFAEAVAGQYQTVSVINIDCVGLKEEPILLTAEANGQKLRDALSQLNFSGEVQPSAGSYFSDQISFNRYSNCFPVVFGCSMDTSMEKGHAHTLQDLPSQLDYPLIEDLAAQLAAFAQEHGDDSFRDLAF